MTGLRVHVIINTTASEFQVCGQRGPTPRKHSTSGTQAGTHTHEQRRERKRKDGWSERGGF